ncbi:NAD(+) synthase [Flavobacterium arcticum]|uniref:NH(3)-dependent NAD(+) synthetase n=1 Tax=Flavobacterium arcticum TaxID=1784713 RepID=A0A345HCD4_9FLAO|nr:NAD(+) synthase [Flavobacterium arcticum]AXG74244.1 NAD(+) synthase [Flavobacterium arcticum]KAF2508168.1 NAD(+) synthase [Flavobacterium arcticum]
MHTDNGFKAEAINNYIVNWLRDYATNAKVKGFVVGISGGIDSALTSTLCAQTGLPTLCLEMPIHQAHSHVQRAKEHIAQLKANYSNVSEIETDLTPVFETFRKQVPESENEHLNNLTLANTRARLRMTTLYYFAGINNALVAGTGNKVEDFGVGFYTKYGDGGVDISPIADLMKSEVRALAKNIGVPQNIIEAKPTDGLFGDDRTDEDQLGASYEELEWAMLEVEKGAQADSFTGRKKEVFNIYIRLNTINQHKMRPIPVCEIPENLK